jgi:hypothetical protein
VTRTATPNLIAGLAARLTDSQDREAYAALVSYVNELPAGDEFRQLTEMLGLLSLVGQRVPDAIRELLTELRAQSRAAADYHAQVDARLANLPNEIAAGVDPKVIAEQMSEVFRQRIEQTGLRDTIGLLGPAVTTLKALSGDLTSSLGPVVCQIDTGISKLVAAAAKVDQHNQQLIAEQRAQDRARGWQIPALAALVIFLIGGLVGILLEKRQTADAIVNIGSQIERVQTPVLPIAATPRKNEKRAGL